MKDGNKKLKIMTIVGTRPEIIRLSSVINELNSSDAIEHILVHTGQNYDFELNEIFFKDLNLSKPNYFLGAAGKNSSTTIGKILLEIDPIFEKEKPDAILILGDTNSCLYYLQKKKYQFFIWKLETDVLIKEFQRKQIG